MKGGQPRTLSAPPKPPKTPPQETRMQNQECLASYKKKLMTCGRVRCKRRVHSVAASPREDLDRRAAKNVISPPQNPPKPPQEARMQNQECLASYKKKLIACGRVRCKRRVHSVAASPREDLERRAAKNVISPPPRPPKTPQNPTAVYKPWSNYTRFIQTRIHPVSMDLCVFAMSILKSGALFSNVQPNQKIPYTLSPLGSSDLAFLI